MNLLGPLSAVYDEAVARISSKRVDPTMGRIVQDTLDVVYEKLDRLVEPEPYDEWHERDCSTAMGPPGPFPCDCKLSKGWKIFLLPPET